MFNGSSVVTLVERAKEVVGAEYKLHIVNGNPLSLEEEAAKSERLLLATLSAHIQAVLVFHF